jgi:hypothetical protein
MNSKGPLHMPRRPRDFELKLPLPFSVSLPLLVFAVLVTPPVLAFFPDLSAYPSSVTSLDLEGRGITEIPPAAFARFQALTDL